MFRLLALLLALNFTSKVDGAPTSLEESGEYGAADDINQSDLILEKNDAELEDASDLEDGTTYYDGDEEETETSETVPSLQTRTLSDSKPSWGQRMSRKFSSCFNPKEREEKTPTQTARDSNFPSGWTLEKNYRAACDREEKRAMREAGLAATNEVRNLLSVPGADPYKDKNLAAKIEAAYYTNQAGLDEPLPKFKGMPEADRFNYKFDKVQQAFEDARKFEVANPNYASYQLEKERAYFPKSTNEYGAASTSGPAKRQASGYDLTIE